MKAQAKQVRTESKESQIMNSINLEASDVQSSRLSRLQQPQARQCLPAKIQSQLLCLLTRLGWGFICTRSSAAGPTVWFACLS